MPRKSLEWNCEELMARKLVTDLRLIEMEFRHHDEDEAASTDVIVLRAVKGESSLEGVKGYPVTISATYGSGTKSAEQLDDIAAAISEAAYHVDDFDPQLDDLYFFSLEPDTATERQDTDKLRKRIVTFPAIAKLVADESLYNATVYTTGAGNLVTNEAGALLTP